MPKLKRDWTDNTEAAGVHAEAHNALGLAVVPFDQLFSLGLYANFAGKIPLSAINYNGIANPGGPGERVGGYLLDFVDATETATYADDFPAFGPRVDQNVVAPFGGFINWWVYLEIDVTGCQVGEEIRLSAHPASDTIIRVITAQDITAQTVTIGYDDKFTFQGSYVQWSPSFEAPMTAQMVYCDWAFHYVTQSGVVFEAPAHHFGGWVVRGSAVAKVNDTLTVTWDPTPFDADGVAIPVPATVGLSLSAPTWGSVESSRMVTVEVPQTAGTYTFTNVPPGKWEVTAYKIADADPGNYYYFSQRLGMYDITDVTPPVLISDNFNRADAAIVGTTTPVGGATYQAVQGATPSIVGNQLSIPGSAATSAVRGFVVESEREFFEIQATYISGPNLSFILNYIDDSNFMLIQYNANGSIEWKHIVGGSESLRTYWINRPPLTSGLVVKIATCPNGVTEIFTSGASQFGTFFLYEQRNLYWAKTKHGIGVMQNATGLVIEDFSVAPRIARSTY